MDVSIAHRIRRTLRSPRRLRFTTEGKWFVAMTIMVGFGAINTGNNLLYLMLGMMLGLIVVSGVMSEITLRGLWAQRIAMGSVFAGHQARLEYRLVNRKRVFPSFSIHLREIERSPRQDDPLGRSSGLGYVRANSGRAGRMSDPDALRVPQSHFRLVPASSSRVSGGQVTLPARGWYRYRAIELATRFPFGLFEKSLRIPHDSDILVFPGEVPPPKVRWVGVNPQGEEPRARSGRGLEYYALRDYQAGEDGRNIHWKVTARRNTLVVRENEQERSRSLVLVLCNVLRRGDEDNLGALSEGLEELERAIEVTAALARRYVEASYSVSLLTLSGEVSSGSGPGQLLRLLRALALIEGEWSEPSCALPRTGEATPTILVVPAQGTVGLPVAHFEQCLVVHSDGTVKEVT